jgi:outer membrane protein TolC
VAAGYDYAKPNRKILPPLAEWNDTWDLSLTVAWNVFDGGRASAGTARARARAEAARYQLDDLERRIRLQVVGALLDLDTAEAAVAVAERGLAAARENLRVAADRHREGLIPSSERLDAELALQRASLDRTETLARVRLAEAGLARALGK